MVARSRGAHGESMAAGRENMTASRIRWLRHDSIDPDGEFNSRTTHASDLLIWFVQDGGGIRALRLGLDGGDLGFPPIMETRLHHSYAVMPTRGAAAGTRLQAAAPDCSDADAGVTSPSGLLHWLLIFATHRLIPLPTGKPGYHSSASALNQEVWLTQGRARPPLQLDAICCNHQYC
jgi:hypothetical protein